MKTIFFIHNILIISILCIFHLSLKSQNFYYGADLSYTNEMLDCGVVYQENNQSKEPFQLFSDAGHNLVRLRLWHTPVFYDTLNTGNRYSDFSDVKGSIQRAKAAGMQVLLDFHLSDFWADPSRQLVPVAWESVANNLPILQDSLYNYVFSTLSALDTEGLLPELVQIGNETNKGIMLTPSQNGQGWFLDWPRNATLFNTAIAAVRAAETQSGKAIKVALHIAGPADTEWFIGKFVEFGVTDFDMIGMSYYWAWHQPTTIAQTGQIIKNLKSDYPNKEVVIFETGYPWTTAWNDNASNIITQLHPNYSPPSPENQKKWMLDLSQSVKNNGGNGVIYWEPAWQSSPCFTPWGQGSHQEHATYFDFQNNALPEGGLYWPTAILTPIPSQNTDNQIDTKTTTLIRAGRIFYFSIQNQDQIDTSGYAISLSAMDGKQVLFHKFGHRPNTKTLDVQINADITAGSYVLSLFSGSKLVESRRVQVL